MGGVFSGVSLSSKLRSQESTAIQMGGVLPYKLEVYCRTFRQVVGVGVSETLPRQSHRPAERNLREILCFHTFFGVKLSEVKLSDSDAQAPEMGDLEKFTNISSQTSRHPWQRKTHRPLNGPFSRGHFPPWRAARKQPVSLNGAFPLLNGRFPECLDGPF